MFPAAWRHWRRPALRWQLALLDSIQCGRHSFQDPRIIINEQDLFCVLQGEKAPAAPAEEAQAGGGGPPAPKHVQRKLIRKVKFLEREFSLPSCKANRLQVAAACSVDQGTG